MNTPKASIVVPTRGGAGRLPHLFDALRAQTEQSWEAIVVVDGDTDNTAALLEAVRDELPVTPIIFPENRGRSAALNAGFDAARGDVLIRCDDDLRPERNYVAGHIARHQGSPVGVVGLCRNVYPDTAYAHVYGRPRDTRFHAAAYAASENTRWRFWGGNVSATRETYDRVGAYDGETFRAYGWEDVDWGYRVHEAGMPVVLAPELETDHHGAATTAEIRVHRAFSSGAARLAFDAKHGAGSSGALPEQRGLWNSFVWRTARRHGLKELLRRSRQTDMRLGRMPRYFAEKQVSLLVEAAAVAGTLYPGEVCNDV